VQFQNGGEYDFSDEKLQDTFEFSLPDGGTILNHDVIATASRSGTNRAPPSCEEALWN
jgi:hypothetical protein